MNERVAVVVGGGIAGLSTAEAIARKAKAAGTPVRVVVLEGDDVPGGKIATKTVGGFVVETGPHGFLDKEAVVFALIDRLGLRESLIVADPEAEKRFVVRAGKLREVPMKPPAFLASSILPLVDKLRVLAEPFARPRTMQDESVWEFARRRIGRGAADVLVDAMVTGIYGGDPKALSLASAFPRMEELERQYGSLIRAQIALAKHGRKAKGARAIGAPTGKLHSFRRGLGELIHALAARTELRTRFRVANISRDDKKRFVVEGADEAMRADAVVLAIPAYEIPQIVGAMAPSALVDRVAQIPYASIAVVVEGHDGRSIARAPEGFGFLVPHGESRDILGSIFASRVFPAHAPPKGVMFRTMLGGARRPELAQLESGAIVERADRELEKLLGISMPRVCAVREVFKYERGIPQYNIGHAEKVAAADAIEREVPGLFVTGNAFRGVAMIACIVDAERVAERVVASLGRHAT